MKAVTDLAAGAAESRKERNPIAAVTRLVSAIAEMDSAEVGVRELGRMLDAAPSSVQKTLDKAFETGLVSQGPTGQWQLGWELFRIASMTMQKMPFAGVQPALDALRDATGETAVISIYDPRSATRMFVATAPSHHSIRFVPELLSWLPMHLGATAVAILAHRSQDERTRIVEASTDIRSPSRATDQAFLDRLTAVRQSGYAMSRDEVNLGASAIAAPIFGTSGVTSSIGVIGPVQRFDTADHNRIAELTIDAARRVSSMSDRTG